MVVLEYLLTFLDWVELLDLRLHDDDVEATDVLRDGPVNKRGAFSEREVCRLGLELIRGLLFATGP